MQQSAAFLEAFGASEADLMANRQGTLTKER